MNEQRASTNQRTMMLVVAHGDDAAGFLGGTIARWADDGWHIIMVRVTNDEKDSINLSKYETIQVNTEEMHQAADVLGISDIVELDYEDGTLADASEIGLREHLIYLYRKYRPYAVCSFDPYGVLYENNQDHIATARAVDEAFWTAMADRYHPEHLEQGLQVHGVYERWYFARRLIEVTTAIDIAATIDRKIEALMTHRVMMRNTLRQLELQAATAGHYIPLLEQPSAAGVRAFIERLVRSEARRAGERHGFEYAEEFRVVRFGGLFGSMEDLIPQ